MALEHWQKHNSNYAVFQPGSQGAGDAGIVLGAKDGQATRHLWDDMRAALSMNNPAYVGFFDDFIGFAGGTAVPLGWTNNATGTGTQVYGALGSFGGVYTVTTGTTANDYEDYALAANFKSENGWMFFTAKFTLSSVAAVTAEVGLTDALTETGGLVFSDHSASGVTAVADDAIVVAFEAAGDANYVVNSVAAGGTPQTLDLGTAPVASTYIQVDFAINSDGDAFIYLNDAYIGRLDVAVTPTVLLTPFFSVKTTTTAGKAISVDWVGVTASR